MSDPFEDKLLHGMSAQSLTAEVRKLLLAVSGGADSVAMAHALAALRRAGALACELAIGHVNHQLRSDQSDADEAFVKDLAARLQLPFASTRVDVRAYAAQHRLSIETAARALRLQALANQCKAMDCDAVATAHHLDDQAETLVHRLMRGTGLRGLCGIRPASRLHGLLFLRPMLCVSRDEIGAYGRRVGLQWRDDATNDSLEPTRNRIRHILLPQLSSDWPRVTQGLSELANQCRQMQERTETDAKAVLTKAIATQQPNRLSLHRQPLADCPPWVFYEVMREALVQLDVGLRDYTQAHFEHMRRLAAKGAGRHQFPCGVVLRAKKKTLTIESPGADST